MCILPFKEFSEYLPSNGLFVDFGTGFGYMANFLSLESQKRNVIGIDIDPKRISIAQKTIAERKNINFICDDIRRLKYIDNIDVITMTDVLHHIPISVHKEYLKCICDRLKSGGKFIIRETNKRRSIKFYIMNYFSEILLYFFSEKCHFYTAKQIKNLLEEIGFTIIRDIRSSPWFIYETVIYVCEK